MVAYRKVITSVASPALVTALLVFASEARATEDRGGLHNGETMSRGAVMPFIEAGWPDVTLGVAYGVTDWFDIGGRVGFVYGPFYLPTRSLLYNGMAFSVPLRFAVAESGDMRVLVHVDPGAAILGFRPLFFAVQMPVGVEVGFRLDEHATFQLGLDVPMRVNLVENVHFHLAPMVGPGMEYRSGKLVLGARGRFGATIAAGGDVSLVWFGFLGQAYFGYKF